MALSHVRSLALAVGALLPACGGDGESVVLGFLDGDGDRSYATAELDGLWVGTTVPLDPGVQRLELTLGFRSFGETPDAVGLFEYSFPGILESGRVDYLALLDGYDLFFSSSGRLSLDTVLFLQQDNGIFLEERTETDLFMSADGTELSGTEIIEVYLNGNLDQVISNLLTLRRVDR